VFCWRRRIFRERESCARGSRKHGATGCGSRSPTSQAFPRKATPQIFAGLFGWPAGVLWQAAVGLAPPPKTAIPRYQVAGAAAPKVENSWIGSGQNPYPKQLYQATIPATMNDGSVARGTADLFAPGGAAAGASWTAARGRDGQNSPLNVEHGGLGTGATERRRR